MNFFYREKLSEDNVLHLNKISTEIDNDIFINLKKYIDNLKNYDDLKNYEYSPNYINLEEIKKNFNKKYFSIVKCNTFKKISYKLCEEHKINYYEMLLKKFFDLKEIKAFNSKYEKIINFRDEIIGKIKEKIIYHKKKALNAEELEKIIINSQNEKVENNVNIIINPQNEKLKNNVNMIIRINNDISDEKKKIENYMNTNEEYLRYRNRPSKIAKENYTDKFKEVSKEYYYNIKEIIRKYTNIKISEKLKLNYYKKLKELFSYSKLMPVKLYYYQYSEKYDKFKSRLYNLMNRYEILFDKIIEDLQYKQSVEKQSGGKKITMKKIITKKTTIKKDTKKTSIKKSVKK